MRSRLPPGRPRPTRRALLLAAPALLLPAVAGAVPTPRSTEGPFYPTRHPADDDSNLLHVAGAPRPALGERLRLQGRVLDAGARPVPGARVEIWQCDANGIYLHPRDRRLDRRDPGFQGFGHAVADNAGWFGFRTIVPVPYAGRTPHIHCKVFRDGREILTSQLYRAGYPQNPGDFLFRRLSPAEQERASMTLRPEPAGGFETAVDIVLAG